MSEVRLETDPAFGDASPDLIDRQVLFWDGPRAAFGWKKKRGHPGKPSKKETGPSQRTATFWGTTSNMHGLALVPGSNTTATSEDMSSCLEATIVSQSF